MPEIPPITNDREFWTTRFFAQRYGVQVQTIRHHARNLTGNNGKGQRRKLSYDAALRFDRYLRSTVKNNASANFN
jgi:hypothetical protein